MTKIIFEVDRDINEAYREDNWVEVEREGDKERRETGRDEREGKKYVMQFKSVLRIRQINVNPECR